jgi:hypothetical protein
MWDVFGLTAGLIGAILIAIAQSGLFSTVHLWLMSLDSTIETMLEPPSEPIVRVTGVDKHMKDAVKRDKWLSTAGWILIALGFGAQLIPHLCKV